MPDDEPVRTARTAAEPMAVSRDELLRGALCVWGLFVGLFAAGIALLFIWLSLGTPPSLSTFGFLLWIGGYSILIAAAVAAFAAAVFTPLVWGLARALRRQRRVGVHASAYVLLGTVLAALAGVMTNLMVPGKTDLILIAAVSALIAVPLGWWLTARAALRRDRGILSRRERRGRIDVDMIAEDAATD
ncbi:hypothetical protein [Microbacterium sp. CIAB417]|uniref:hypothetical protein n=1 Tax=Microbacterium sp. CIAB417 TaxID=2860287 RepID=UPI001FACE434|nr:hypothetical protein [Microbacterium sp. CIAB417]